MMTFNVTHEEAYLHVQARRFCASPNLNFQRQIDAFEDIHEASLAMTQHAKQLQANGTAEACLNGHGNAAARRKRGAAADDDGKEDGDEDLQERNLHAQRKRRGSDHEGVHHYMGEQAM